MCRKWQEVELLINGKEDLPMNRRSILVLLLLLILLAVGCGHGEPQDGQRPAPDPELEAPAAEPQRQGWTLPWEIPEEFLTSEDYFSQVRPYQMEQLVCPYPGDRTPDDQVYLRHEGEVVWLSQREGGRTLWACWAPPDCRWLMADRAGVYGITADASLLRIPYASGQAEILFTDGTGQLLAQVERSDYQLWSADDCVLFFMAGTDKGLGIYRLYVPEKKVELLLDGLDPENAYFGYGGYPTTKEIPDEGPATAEVWRYMPIPSNVEVQWLENNPNYAVVYEALANSPDCPYDPKVWGESEFAGWVQTSYELYAQYAQYFNAATGERYEMPAEGIYREPPRTDDNEAKHGEAWWLDFAAEGEERTCFTAEGMTLALPSARADRFLVNPSSGVRADKDDLFSVFYRELYEQGDTVHTWTFSIFRCEQQLELPPYHAAYLERESWPFLFARDEGGYYYVDIPRIFGLSYTERAETRASSEMMQLIYTRLKPILIDFSARNGLEMCTPEIN